MQPLHLLRMLLRLPLLLRALTPPCYVRLMMLMPPMGNIPIRPPFG
jgi:hypothetical protein